MNRLSYFTLSNSISFLALNLINSFGVAFLYTRYQKSFIYSIGLLILIRVVYIILLPFFAGLIGKIGTRNSVVISMLLMILANLPLYFVDKNTSLIYLWVLLLGLSFCFYFLPISLFTSKYTNSETRGIQMGKIYSGIIFASALTPLISGHILALYSIKGFVLLLTLITITSTLFFFKLDNLHFKYNGGLRNIFKFDRSLLKASWIETCHFSTRNLGVFWTLYIFIFFGEDYRKFGLILTAITLFSGILNLFVGKYLNQHNRKDILRTQVIFSPFSWIFRLLAYNAVSIFFADAFHSLNGYIRESAVETTAYDLINRDEHKEVLDEKVVLREILITLGIITTMVIGVLLASLFSLKASFYLGILISFGYLII